MSKPVDVGYRAAILRAFDRHTIRSIKEVNNFLKENEQYKSYHSTRRMLSKLVEEGLLTELPVRGDNNSVQYSKLVFTQAARLRNKNGGLVTTKEFIALVMDNGLPDILHPKAREMIQGWMLDMLATSYPEPYKGKRDVPSSDELKRKIERTLVMLRETHSFLKMFLESGITSPVAREILAEEFKTDLAVEHVTIIERLWVENDD